MKDGRCKVCRHERDNWKGNPPNKEKTHCPRGHVLDGDNLMIRVTDGKIKRSCRECHNEQRRRYYRLKEKPIKHPRNKPGPRRKYY
jgi:hypothetical protein